MTTRRKFLKNALTIPAVAALSNGNRAAAQPVDDSPGTSPSVTRRWPLCLDTATLRPTPLLDKIRFASEAGFDAIEPWDGELREYEKNGGDLVELGQRIRDAGLFVPSVIGLWNAIPATKEEWDKNLPETRNRMRMISAIGAEFVQVIPQPARPRAEFDPHWAAKRYRELIEIGLKDYNLKPALVFVNFLEGCRTLGQAAGIALDSGHPQARIIPDVFHMHIGGSGFGSLKKLRGDFIAIFQFNDAPATPVRDKLQDSHRVFPGDGILPLEQSIRDLAAINFEGCISLELYNPDYWKRDPLSVAREGFENTRTVI
ncbi:MAG: sugar phosphate isomerase/epimerase, partial [Planctomycetota bacterium]